MSYLHEFEFVFLGLPDRNIRRTTPLIEVAVMAAIRKFRIIWPVSSYWPTGFDISGQQRTVSETHSGSLRSCLVALLEIETVQAITVRIHQLVV
ncbi:hypothetical protein WDW86_11250 [Bdellovibrionota bacterium FG-2]